MDGLTDRFAISVSHVSVLTRDKNIRTTVAKVKQEGRLSQRGHTMLCHFVLLNISPSHSWSLEVTPLSSVCV